MIKLSVLKNRLSGILSVVSGILSVVGIPPVPIPEEIQLLMYTDDADLFAATSIFILEEFFFPHMLITIVFLY